MQRRKIQRKLQMAALGFSLHLILLYQALYGERCFTAGAHYASLILANAIHRKSHRRIRRMIHDQDIPRSNKTKSRIEIEGAPRVASNQTVPDRIFLKISARLAGPVSTLRAIHCWSNF